MTGVADGARGPDGGVREEQSAGPEEERRLGGVPCLPMRKACILAWMSWEMDRAEGGRRAALTALSGVDELDRTAAEGGEETEGRAGSGGCSESVGTWASGEAAISPAVGSLEAMEEAGSAMARGRCKAASSPKQTNGRQLRSRSRQRRAGFNVAASRDGAEEQQRLAAEVGSWSTVTTDRGKGR
jgi:hypothetical protein